MGIGGCFPSEQSILGMKLTSYIHLVPRVTMSGAVHLLPHMPLWHSMGHLCLISDIIFNKVRFFLLLCTICIILCVVIVYSHCRKGLALLENWLLECESEEDD